MSGRDRLRRAVRGAPLLIEVATFSVLVRLRLAVLPMARVLGLDEALPALEPRPGAEALVGRLEWAVNACLSRRPLRARCLVRALVLRHMLRRRRLPCQLVISVRPDGDHLTAHAEVRVPRPGEAADPLSLLVVR